MQLEGGNGRPDAAPTGVGQGGDPIVPPEQPLASFLEWLPVAVFVLQAEGNPVYANVAAYKLLGRGADPSIPVSRLADTYRARLAGTGEPYPTERMPIVRALHGESSTVDDMVVDGPAGPIPVEVWATPVVGPDGEVAYAVAAFQDITERRRAEADASRLQDELLRRSRWLEAVREVQSAMLSGAQFEAALDLVASRARELLEGDSTSIGIPGPEHTLEIIAADGEYAAQLRGRQVPLTDSIMGDVIAKGAAVVTSDAATDARRAQPVVQLGLGPAVFLPLIAEGRAFGSLSVARHRGKPVFSEAEIALAESFANQAAIAVQYGRAQQELARLAVLEDRERIAKDLHDGIIQSLFAVGMGLSGVAVSTQDARVARRLEEAVDELDRVIRDVRSYIFALRPGILAGGELRRALTDLAHDLEARTGVATTVDVDAGAAAGLAPRAAEVVQVVREALSNVGRHAEARACRVSLAPSTEGIVLEITDDGRGFDPDRARGPGQGLGNLAERARALGGRLEIDSAPGRGATLRVLLPAGD